jgi:hypothetical protein
MTKDAGVFLMMGGSRSSDEVGHGNEKKKRPLPFPCVVLEHPEEITNKFSGEKVMLEPDAVAVYDSIKGAELVGEHSMVQKGIDWFIKNEPDAYMKLLD